jgi:4-amino-4-deoxy-L-arabinose transferase-like glycosyltransferase
LPLDIEDYINAIFESRLDVKEFDNMEIVKNRCRLWPLLIIIIIILDYGIGPTRLPLWGEETRRALFGINMAQTGNCLVAFIQGHALPDRPTLQYWELAIIHKWIHPLDPLTIRISMVIVTLLTSLMIWWYASRFLSDVGAFVAAVAFPTMGHVFDIGRRAETDGLFTLLLAGALLVWHMGYMRKWSYFRLWMSSAIIAALATLTKGTQGPVAFFGTIYLFLLIRRDWKCLFNWSHLLGIIIFIGLIAAWQVPFYRVQGWEGTQLAWFGEATNRIDTNFVVLVKHLINFPIEVLGGTLPWSVLLIGFIYIPFWKMDNKIRSSLTFMLLGMLAIFTPVWIIEGSRLRYVMPMYPLLAVICGIVVHQCLLVDITDSLRIFWRNYLRIAGIIIVGIAAFFLVITIAAGFVNVPLVQGFSMPLWLAILLVICTTCGMLLINRQTTNKRYENGILVTFILAVLLAICYNGAVINFQANFASKIRSDVIELHNSLPRDSELVCFEPLHHRFVYHYSDPIPIVNKPETANDVPNSVKYFALWERNGQIMELPFQWEKVTEFILDRVVSVNLREKIIIGKVIQE